MGTLAFHRTTQPSNGNGQDVKPVSADDDSLPASKLVERRAQLSAALGKAPANEEARRRLRWFFTSLACDMPSAPPIASMRSFSVLIPMYAETVVFSPAELLEPGSDGRPLLVVIASLYSDEWRHFCERVSADAALGLDPTRATELVASDSKLELETRWWASMRGQTLATVASEATHLHANSTPCHSWA